MRGVCQNVTSGSVPHKLVEPSIILHRSALHAFVCGGRVRTTTCFLPASTAETTLPAEWNAYKPDGAITVLPGNDAEQNWGKDDFLWRSHCRQGKPMANFKIVLSDPKSRKAYQKEVEQKAAGLLGKKIGETIDGGALGLAGYKIELTGGSDKDGFPMRRDVDGAAKKKILLSSGPGFHPDWPGKRKRKSIRGNMVSEAITQVNAKVVQAGGKTIEDCWNIKAKEPVKKEATVAPAETRAAETKPTEKAAPAEKTETPADEKDVKKEAAAEEKNE